jgi:asparagine synthase (glutamine-hydrolysing)
MAPYLPDKILWRQKEQFSDGVGYGWFDGLRDSAELVVTDEMMKNPKPDWGSDTTSTKEAYVSLYTRSWSRILC